MAKAKAAAKGASKKTVEKHREKVVEDKTFGLKNKNKSKKVQQYIQQVTANSKTGGKSQAYLDAQAAKKKREKEERKQAEREMALLLGEAYVEKKKKKKPTKKDAEQEAADKEAEEAQQKIADEKDFGTPVSPLRDVFGQGSKVKVERVCVELVWKDNLVGKAPGDGSPCLHVKVNDGTTLNPMKMIFMGETPTTFEYKVHMILDVRNAVAIVRGDTVFLEIPKGSKGTSAPQEDAECSVEAASERLTEFIRQKIQDEEEIRARGGIPIEERIEEERALLKGPLTPVTAERFKEWKEKKRLKKLAEQGDREREARKGKSATLSGRALFNMDKSLFMDDPDAKNDTDYSRREEVEEEDAGEGANGGNDAEEDDDEEEEGEEEDGDSESEADDAAVGASAAAAAPPAPMPGADAAAAAIQEKLYLEGDDDLDDLDDLDDDDDDDEDEE